MFYPIPPCPKPRMTRADRWKKRDCVERYWAFKDRCRELGIVLRPAGNTITFLVPMPKSWSKKKRAAMRGQAHTQKPDVDNYLKALQDAILEDDSGIWCYAGLAKVWTDGPGGILIEDGDWRPDVRTA